MDNINSNRTTPRKGRKDLQNIIGAVLEAPLKDGVMEELEGGRSLESMKKKNTTILTRIVIQMAVDAMKGDEKKAKLLFDYGGMAPVKEQQVAVDLPQFVDDMSVSITEVGRAMMNEDEDEESE